MLFTRFYATGTRTVRGLEALTLSTPPIPGHSIVKRPDNGGLFSLGEVFRQKGYEPLYLYGGFAHFHNMGGVFLGKRYKGNAPPPLQPQGVHFEENLGAGGAGP